MNISRVVTAVILGQLVGLLGWIGPLFFVLVLAVPLISGGIAAARRIPLLLVCVLWFSAGINMLWTDWLVNREDVVFHLALSAVMPILAAAGFGLVAVATRQRTKAVAQ